MAKKDFYVYPGFSESPMLASEYFGNARHLYANIDSEEPNKIVCLGELVGFAAMLLMLFLPYVSITFFGVTTKISFLEFFHGLDYIRDLLYEYGVGNSTVKSVYIYGWIFFSITAVALILSIVENIGELIRNQRLFPFGGKVFKWTALILSILIPVALMLIARDINREIMGEFADIVGLTFAAYMQMALAIILIVLGRLKRYI